MTVPADIPNLPPTPPAIVEKAKAPVGGYPNFSGAGVLGNPAFHTGRWLYAQYGFAGSGESLNLQISEVAGNLRLRAIHAKSKGNENTLLELSAKITPEISMGVIDSTEGSATFGILHSKKSTNLLLRTGASWSPDNESGNIAAETRFPFEGTEITLSMKKELKKISGKMSDRETRFGVQLKKGTNMLSIGAGGPSWRDVVLHARKFKKWGNINVSATAPKGHFKNGQVAVGVTRFLPIKRP